MEYVKGYFVHDMFTFEYQYFMFSNMFFRANTCFKTFSICGIVFIFATTNIACIAQLCVETRGREKMNLAFRLGSTTLTNQRSMT